MDIEKKSDSSTVTTHVLVGFAFLMGVAGHVLRAPVWAWVIGAVGLFFCVLMIGRSTDVETPLHESTQTYRTPIDSSEDKPSGTKKQRSRFKPKAPFDGKVFEAAVVYEQDYSFAPLEPIDDELGDHASSALVIFEYVHLKGWLFGLGNCDWMARYVMARRGLRSARCEELAGFAKQYPKEQLEHRIVALGSQKVVLFEEQRTGSGPPGGRGGYYYYVTIRRDYTPFVDGSDEGIQRRIRGSRNSERTVFLAVRERKPLIEEAQCKNASS